MHSDNFVPLSIPSPGKSDIGYQQAQILCNPTTLCLIPSFSGIELGEVLHLTAISTCIFFYSFIIIFIILYNYF